MEFKFETCYNMEPTGDHKVTIVWLHGNGDNGSSWSSLLQGMRFRNIKWICPTAPLRPVKLFGGREFTAWFDLEDISKDACVESLDRSAVYVANLLADEPPHVKCVIGGFSMGAATALYSAACFARGRFGNGDPYNVNLSAIVGLSGWLPDSTSFSNMRGFFDNNMQGLEEAEGRAAALPVMLCHDKGDCIVPFEYCEKAAAKLNDFGFKDVTVKGYSGLGHCPRNDGTEIRYVVDWLQEKQFLIN